MDVVLIFFARNLFGTPLSGPDCPGSRTYLCGTHLSKNLLTYPPSDAIVVSVHACSRVMLICFARVDKTFSKLNSIFYVITASAPQKVPCNKAVLVMMQKN